MNLIKETKSRDNHGEKLLSCLMVVIALGILMLVYMKGMITVLTSLIIAGILFVVLILWLGFRATGRTGQMGQVKFQHL
ncbi:MAG: hypothetical protein HY754_12420 [Nitrospirae bacterium]|nr:hypothetical protein [Nitrospirota bacterium]